MSVDVARVADVVRVVGRRATSTLPPEARPGVFAAIDQGMGRMAALLLLHPELARPIAESLNEEVGENSDDIGRAFYEVLRGQEAQ